MNRRFFLSHEAILGLLTVIVLGVLAQFNDQFLTIDNLLNQARLMTEVGLIALAMTFVIVTGGIDLSVGSIVGLVAVLLGTLWHDAGFPLPVAVTLALVTGVICGALNGAIIACFSVPPLIATLATLAIYRGLAEGISQARSVRGYPDWFLTLGQGQWLGVPLQVWLLAAVALIAACVLGMTVFGRSTYAIGANETAARFSGIAVDRTRVLIYAGSGLCASLAAVVFVSRVTTTRSDMGMGWELDAITAVVLGGTSIFGGRGTIVGTALGLILMQALKNGLLLSGQKGDSTIVVIGTALILTVLASNLSRRRQPT